MLTALYRLTIYSVLCFISFCALVFLSFSVFEVHRILARKKTNALLLAFLIYRENTIGRQNGIDPT